MRSYPMNLIKIALHLAAQSGSSACVSTLVSCGADPNLLDSIQQTPLFLATEHGHGDCIQIVRTAHYYLNLCLENLVGG